MNVWGFCLKKFLRVIFKLELLFFVLSVHLSFNCSFLFFLFVSKRGIITITFAGWYMHMVLKSRGRTHEVYVKSYEWGYIWVMNIFGGGYIFFGLFNFYWQVLWKVWSESPLLSPLNPHTPPHPPCASNCCILLVFLFFWN